MAAHIDMAHAWFPGCDTAAPPRERVWRPPPTLSIQRARRYAGGGRCRRVSSMSVRCVRRGGGRLVMLVGGRVRAYHD